MKLKVFTAFSGYDSQCLALNVLKKPERGAKGRFVRSSFDYELVGWSEIDKYAIKAHNALFPQWADRNYGDISKIDWSQVPDFDLFTYSSPCQDFSIAGKQQGATKGSGTRSSLLWECERAIEAKRPKYLLFENVAAVVSKKFIRLFNQWQLTLERLGYSNFVQVLNAKTHGYPTPVPQNRERVFMVSILKADECYYFPDEQQLQTRLVDILEKNVDESYYISADRLKGLLASTEKEKEKGNSFGFKPKEEDAIAGTISTHAGGRKTDNFIKVVGNLQPDNLFGESIRQQNQVIDSSGISPAITAEHGRHEFKIAEPQVLGWSRDDHGNVVNRHPVDVANTICATTRENTTQYVLEPQCECIGMLDGNQHESIRRIYSIDGIAPTQVTCGGGNQETKIAIPANVASGEQMMEIGGVCDLSYPSSTTRRGRVQDGGKVTPALTQHTENSLYRIEPINADADGCSRTLTGAHHYSGNIVDPKRGQKEMGVQDGMRIRKLTPLECFRLMGVSDEDAKKIIACTSKTQCYKLAGNSIVVNCIAAIFRQLFIKNENKHQQTEIF